MAYISRTPASNGNKKTFTISMWIKRGNVTDTEFFFAASSDELKFHSTTDNLKFWIINGAYGINTNRVFKDPSAFYHIVVAVDTTLAAAGDRIKMYINGVQETSFATENNPPQDSESRFSDTSYEMTIGRASDGFKGVMSHVQFVDGAALAPTEFGEFDSISGIWTIKTGAYSTPGTNGFFLKMEDRTNLDLDSSSNAHTFTTTGTITPTYDNPSNNFCTMNPLDNYGASSTFTNGNNTVAIGTNDRTNTSTMGLTKGKWYFEVKYTPGSQIYSMIGIANYPVGSVNSTTSGYLTHNAIGNWGYSVQGGGTSTSNYAKKSENNVATFTSPYPAAGYSGNQFVADDIVQVAIDLDNNKIWWGKNNLGYWGTDGYNGVPNTNTNGFAIADPTTIVNGTYYVACGRSDSGGVTWTFNFGNGYFGTTAVASTNADDAGIGSFEYDVPAGFYAICTKNIKVYG